MPAKPSRETIRDRIDKARAETKEYRDRGGMSDLAKKIHQHQSWLNKAASRKWPVLEVLDALSLALGVNYRWLATGNGPMHPTSDMQRAETAARRAELAAERIETVAKMQAVELGRSQTSAPPKKSTVRPSRS